MSREAHAPERARSKGSGRHSDPGVSRRDLLRGATAGNLALPALHGLETGAGAAGPRPALGAVVQADSSTLTIALNGSPSDLDPHSADDYRSAIDTRGPYEQLIAYKGSATDEYVGLLAESWEGFYCNPRVEELLTTSRDQPDPAAYQAALSEIQQTISRDGPPAIYYLQRQWTKILRGGIEGFVFNPINIGTYDFHTLHRTA